MKFLLIDTENAIDTVNSIYYLTKIVLLFLFYLNFFLKDVYSIKLFTKNKSLILFSLYSPVRGCYVKFVHSRTLTI